MKKYMQNVDLHLIQCTPTDIDAEKFPIYLEICRLFEKLTELYMKEPLAYCMEAEGLVLQNIFSADP